MRLALLAAAVAAFVSSPVLAADTQRVDFTQVLLDDQGCPFWDDPHLTTVRTTDTVAGPNCQRPEKMMPPDLTLGLAVYESMRVPEQGMSWDEGIRRDEFGRAVRFSKDYPLLSQDLDLIKKMAPKLWGAPILGAMSRALALSKDGAK